MSWWTQSGQIGNLLRQVGNSLDRAGQVVSQRSDQLLTEQRTLALTGRAVYLLGPF